MTLVPKNKEVSCFKFLRLCIYLLINVKMLTIVGILTFMSRINFVLSRVGYVFFYNLGPVFERCQLSVIVGNMQAECSYLNSMVRTELGDICVKN